MLIFYLELNRLFIITNGYFFRSYSNSLLSNFDDNNIDENLKKEISIKPRQNNNLQTNPSVDTKIFFCISYNSNVIDHKIHGNLYRYRVS